jgi:hypothetical protein
MNREKQSKKDRQKERKEKKNSAHTHTHLVFRKRFALHKLSNLRIQLTVNIGKYRHHDHV